MILGITAGNYIAPQPTPIVPTEFVVGHAGTLYVGNIDHTAEITVDWGDGSPIETTTSSLTHEYSGSTFIGKVYKSSNVLAIAGTPLVSVVSIQHGLSGITFSSSAADSSVNLLSVPESIPSTITTTERMFYGASSFNQDISSWDVSNVDFMTDMFYGVTSFNQDISSWDVSSVSDMVGMFYEATSFNQDISSWDVSNVTDMSDMFYGATSFNGDISSWDVSSVSGMESVFYGATSFNSDISLWDVSNVTDMGFMFYGASSFNQDLSGWCVPDIASKPSLFDTGATAWVLPRPVWGTCPNG